MAAATSVGARREDMSRISFSVDPAMYLAGASGAAARVHDDHQALVRPDLGNHYSGAVCAGRWIALCDDPEFGHAALVELIDRTCATVMEAMHADSGSSVGRPLISLGSGDGEVDLRILRGIEARGGANLYCCLDSSFELLRVALGRVARSEGLPRGLPIRAHCADFTRLADPCALPGAEPAGRLFALTGFTLGNHDESALLKGISTLMSARDYLLVDARLHDFLDGGEIPDLPESVRQSVVERFELESVKRFVFGPLEVATLARVEDVGFEFEITNEVTVVPKALNILISCTGLETKMRLTGEPVRRSRVELAVTTLYRYVDLQRWFLASGYRIVWHQRFGDVGLFLLGVA